MTMTTHSISTINFKTDPKPMLDATIVRHTSCDSAIDAAIKLIELLCEFTPDFPQKLLAIDKHYATSHKRCRLWHRERYVHTDQAGIYPYDPDRIAKYTRRIEKAGLWVRTNLSSNQMYKLMGEACEAAGVRFTL